MTQTSDVSWNVLGKQFCDLNFDNHVNGDAQFKILIDIKHV